MTRASRRCMTCRSYNEKTEECRHDPPVPMLIEGKILGVWPKVFATDWCGRHLTKDPEAREQ